MRSLLTLLFMGMIAGQAYAEDKRNLTVTHSAGEEKRIALVIGNSRYAEKPLMNPANDAHDMAAQLRELGFDVVEKIDATQKEMNRAIVQFGEKLNARSVALFYYAGHGMQVKGKNYLVPVDAEIAAEMSVRAETVDVDTVLDQLNRSPLSIVILDACRNNPFERRFRSAGGGLAMMDAPKGTLVAYATAPGSVASDGIGGRNGLYTRELLKAMRTPGLPVERMFKEVRKNVTGASSDTQTPWEMSSLTGEFYFRASGTQVASLEPISVPLGGGLSLDDIKKQQVARGQWDTWQRAMKADYDQVATLNAAADLQATAWERFLGSYSQDNPFSTEDENLRTQAQGRKQSAQAQQQPDAARPVTSNLAQVGKKTFRDCPDCPALVVIPAGSFEMGGSAFVAENPVHRVTISRAFALGQSEVTQGQWKVIMGSNPSHSTSCGDTCPVENVSWNDIQTFIQKINVMTGKQYRLPSEAEWEYACYGGIKTEYCGSNNPSAAGWFNGNSNSQIHPAGQRQANGYGLVDMSGNVLEWVEDSYHGNYAGAPTDGGAWSGDGAKRVLRGGSWYHTAESAVTTARLGFEPAGRSGSIGFRLVRMLP